MGSENIFFLVLRVSFLHSWEINYFVTCNR